MALRKPGCEHPGFSFLIANDCDLSTRMGYNHRVMARLKEEGMVERKDQHSDVSGEPEIGREPRAEIEALREEHRALLRELRRLDRSLARLSVKQAEAALVIPVLESLHAFLADHVHPHMRRERETLHPLVKKSGLSRKRDIRAILAGDDGLEKECRQLRRALQRLRREKDERETVRQVIAIGEGIIEGIIEHVHREEEVLFPRLEEALVPPRSSRG
jgi:hemerythrin-like domain-containing protein